jgi:hypothetical protein
MPFEAQGSTTIWSPYLTGNTQRLHYKNLWLIKKLFPVVVTVTKKHTCTYSACEKMQKIFNVNAGGTYCNVLRYVVPLCHVFTLLITSEHQLWRARVQETPFGLLHLFIYDFTSRHYNLCLQCVMTLWLYVPERSFDLSSVFLFYVSLLCVCQFICCPWNRVFAPQKEDTLSQGLISCVSVAAVSSSSVA